MTILCWSMSDIPEKALEVTITLKLHESPSKLHFASSMLAVIIF